MIAFSLTPPLINIEMVAAYELQYIPRFALRGMEVSYNAVPGMGLRLNVFGGASLLEASAHYHPGLADGRFVWLESRILWALSPSLS